MTNRSFEYTDDELALARSLHTLKSTNVRTGNVPKETSDDESMNILGTQYLRKRSMSDSNIALQDDSNAQNMVSKISYSKHRASKSFDELTFNRVFPTHEFAYGNFALKRIHFLPFFTGGLKVKFYLLIFYTV